MKIQPSPKTKSKRISARAILMALVAILAFTLLLSSVLGLMSKYTTMRKHIKNLKLEQSTLVEKKVAVTDMNNYIDTPEGQERIFRDKFRLLKPGEGVIVVTDDEIPEVEVINKKSAFGLFWVNLKKGLGL